MRLAEMVKKMKELYDEYVSMKEAIKQHIEDFTGLRIGGLTPTVFDDELEDVGLDGEEVVLSGWVEGDGAVYITADGKVYVVFYRAEKRCVLGCHNTGA